MSHGPDIYPTAITGVPAGSVPNPMQLSSSKPLRAHAYAPNACVAFTEPMDAVLANTAETNMRKFLTGMGNAFQVGRSEKWGVAVPFGEDPAATCRRVSKQLHDVLPVQECIVPTVPVAVANAFRAATETLYTDDTCVRKARLWQDNLGGHQFEVEAIRATERAAEREFEQHKLSEQTKQAEYAAAQVKAREASKQEKERTRREVMCAMIQKGYSIADIQLLTNSD